MDTKPNVIFVLLIIVTVVSVDVLFFRNHFAQRLLANIGIVAVYVAFYWRFFKK